MNKTINTFAAVLLLGSTAIAPFAYAQDAATPAAPTTEAPAATGVAPSTDTMAPAATTGAMNDTYLTEQSTTQVSANDFIGQPVLNSANESIGDINDLIIEEQGGIVAAIVGVGGFIGIGEKNVAVPMSKLTVTREADGNDIKLTTMETAETLKAAPEFKTLDDQADASGAMTTPTDSTTTSSTVTK